MAINDSIKTTQNYLKNIRIFYLFLCTPTSVVETEFKKYPALYQIIVTAEKNMASIANTIYGINVALDGIDGQNMQQKIKYLNAFADKMLLRNIQLNNPDINNFIVTSKQIAKSIKSACIFIYNKNYDEANKLLPNIINTIDQNIFPLHEKIKLQLPTLNLVAQQMLANKVKKQSSLFYNIAKTL